MLTAGVTSCGNRGNNDGSSATIRIFTYSGNEFEAVTMDSVMKKIEDTVGVKIAFEGAVADDYYTKLTPMMGSQDWPDIIWSDPENSGGRFSELVGIRGRKCCTTSTICSPGNAERYPYLTKLIYSDQYKNIIYHEGHYIVPAVQTSTAWAIYYRADWLEQIGFVDESGNAKAPVTLDEFEYVMSRFFRHGALYRRQRPEDGADVRHFAQHAEFLCQSAVRCIRYHARLGHYGNG